MTHPAQESSRSQHNLVSESHQAPRRTCQEDDFLACSGTAVAFQVYHAFGAASRGGAVAGGLERAGPGILVALSPALGTSLVG